MPVITANGFAESVAMAAEISEQFSGQWTDPLTPDELLHAHEKDADVPGSMPQRVVSFADHQLKPWLALQSMVCSNTKPFGKMTQQAEMETT